MATIVLVHGAWGGSYGFAKLRPLLAAPGHLVFSPSLTGIGERSHLASADITLDTHIQDVRNTIFYEDLDDITLVGFSYGGMVITGLLDDIADQVANLIYVDALVPGNGQSAGDLIGPLGDGPGDLVDGWGVPPLSRQLATPEATAWSEARRTVQPFRTFVDPVRLTKPLEQWDLTRTYIKATADPDESDESGFWTAARHAEASADWDYLEIASTHMVPYDAPDQLAALLLGVVES